MNYKILSQDERDDIIISFALAQEKDVFCHTLNLERYNQMLSVLPDGDWKKHITTLRDQTEKRLAEVRGIVDATYHQMPPIKQIEAAKKRLKKKLASGA